MFLFLRFACMIVISKHVISSVAASWGDSACAAVNLTYRAAEATDSLGLKYRQMISARFDMKCKWEAQFPHPVFQPFSPLAPVGNSESNLELTTVHSAARVLRVVSLFLCKQRGLQIEMHNTFPYPSIPFNFNTFPCSWWHWCLAFSIFAVGGGAGSVRGEPCMELQELSVLQAPPAGGSKKNTCKD